MNLNDRIGQWLIDVRYYGWGIASLFVTGERTLLQSLHKASTSILARLEEAAKTQERWRHLLLNDVET